MSNKYDVDKKCAEQSAKLLATFIDHTEKGDCMGTIFAKSLYQYVRNIEQTKHMIKLLADNFKVPINTKKIKREEVKYIDNHLCSFFKSEKGTTTFIIDTLLKTGRYTVSEIAREAQVENKVVLRRIKVLRNQGREIQKLQNKIGVT